MEDLPIAREGAPKRRSPANRMSGHNDDACFAGLRARDPRAARTPKAVARRRLACGGRLCRPRHEAAFTAESRLIDQTTPAPCAC